jgi:hypothetical protein
MNHQQYIECLRNLLGGSAEEIREANAKLYAAAVPEEQRQTDPDLALADAASDL